MIRPAPKNKSASTPDQSIDAGISETQELSLDQLECVSAGSKADGTLGVGKTNAGWDLKENKKV
jgi:hypothetical protein